MPSTYTTNLGIEKIGTGEQSGTWGTTTNVNFDLIDQAVNGITTVTLASAGTSISPNDLPITNGAVSEGRNAAIIFADGGDLGANAYVQLTPSDAEKIVFIRNSLSGSRSLFIFQGTYSASNDYEIPNGKDVLLKFAGTGVSSVVSPVLENLTLSDITITNSSALGSAVLSSAVFNGGIEEQQYNLSGTEIDPANGTIQYKTLSANTTFTEVLSDGEYVTLMIDDGAGYTITWPTISWVGGDAPVLGTTGYNIIEIWHVNGSLYGSFIGAA